MGNTRLIQTMYSQSNPSPRYAQLLEQYRLMHQTGFMRRVGNELVSVKPEDTFSGRGISRFVRSIQRLIKVTKARTVLDYGSGKGAQYSENVKVRGKIVAPTLHEYWNVSEITCIDPGIEDVGLPAGKRYDGVVLTHVLDHIPEEDLPWVLDLIFSVADKFVYCAVADFPSPTFLPNGENARVTLHGKDWWTKTLADVNEKYPDVVHCVAMSTQKKDPEGEMKQVTSYVHNCSGLVMPGAQTTMSFRIKVGR